MTDGLFNPEAFEQMPGQIALEQYDVRYELYDRMGYKLSRAMNYFTASSPEDAALEAKRSAQSRGMHAEVLLVQRLWPVRSCSCSRDDRTITSTSSGDCPVHWDEVDDES